MASGLYEKDPATRLSTELFQRIEFVVYVALGILLSVPALLSLGSAALLLLEGTRDWSGTRAIFLIVDRLMSVLMLIEMWGPNLQHSASAKASEVKSVSTSEVGTGAMSE